MFSTRGRYALRIMLDLAEHRNGGFIPLRDVAERQEISLKYIERIMASLSRDGLVEGMHGKGGGYRLVKDPADVSALDVLRSAEGELAPVACLECGARPCPRAADCRTLPMWKRFDELTQDYFASVKLSELMRGDPSNEYVI